MSTARKLAIVVVGLVATVLVIAAVSWWMSHTSGFGRPFGAIWSGITRVVESVPRPPRWLTRLW